MKTVNVLGTDWAIVWRDEAEDDTLKGLDGYCDYTSNTIVIANDRGNTGFADYQEHERRVMRHEIIHAFMYESGLGQDWEHPEIGHDETAVDWVARQFSKLYKAFEEAGCL